MGHTTKRAAAEARPELYGTSNRHRLCALLGEKLKHIRWRKNLSRKQAKWQLGISFERYNILERGLDIPQPYESERILAWAFEGKIYKRQAAPYKYKTLRQQWRMFPVRVPRKLWNQIDLAILRHRRKVDISYESIIIYALKRLINDFQAWTQFMDIAEAYEESRMMWYLQQDKALRHLVHSDARLIKKYSVPVKPEEVLPHEEIMSRPVDEFDGLTYDVQEQIAVLATELEEKARGREAELVKLQQRREKSGYGGADDRDSEHEQEDERGDRETVVQSG
jgi:hypothetical protein